MQICTRLLLDLLLVHRFAQIELCSSHKRCSRTRSTSLASDDALMRSCRMPVAPTESPQNTTKHAAEGEAFSTATPRLQTCGLCWASSLLSRALCAIPTQETAGQYRTGLARIARVSSAPRAFYQFRACSAEALQGTPRAASAFGLNDSSIWRVALTSRRSHINSWHN